ncbi:Glucuronosyltransferase protein [Dioscorea alata]|uniref:Glucuronosyltransferase protein n=1 Tax=Dioscorea alata TaxID=55571 RepID=A0ACB7WBE0_DIOAL|nr:Glucuronosyltransferase protein [Dioscorea alata]
MHSCVGAVALSEGIVMGVSQGYRTSGTLDDLSRRKQQKSKFLKEFDDFFGVHHQERSSNCKFRSLKIVLSIIIFGAILTFFSSPTLYHTDHALHSSSRWIWNKSIVSEDSRYVSPLIVNWTQTLKVVGKINDRKKRMNVGLLNFNASEVNYWQNLLPNSVSNAIHLEYANNNITWDILYPEWIDEEEETQVPSCPKFPDPELPKNSEFDLIAVKLPCNKSGSWSRDVARLHLQLTAAKLTAASMDIGKKPVHVLFITNCFPIPNLFPCKNLITREGNAWLYNITDPKYLSEKLRLPIGSCELASPLINTQDQLNTGIWRRREAYVTILHSAHVYVCGAIAAAQSIKLAGSTRDLVILVDESISDYHRNGLEESGWKVRTIKRIRNPKAERNAYNEWNYSKFRLWQLTDYDKVIFIDADLLILRNIDVLFEMPEITATGNNATLFNSGVMVVEPCNCTFDLLMEYINEIKSYNGGDQGYLNEIFTWWHRIPKTMNFLKHFWIGDKEIVKQKKTRLFGADPPALYVLHYLGLKPWLCFRDYDCNWNFDIMQEFASDIAHSRWWKVHDKMPKKLQKFCLLRTKQKAGLEWHRREAQKANYSDGHWKLKINDSRLDVCFENFCDYKRMLLNWSSTAQ